MTRSVHALPKPEAVARLIASHGIEAATERWSHIAGARTFAELIRRGIAAGGQARSRRSRPRGTDPAVELAAIEVAYVLGSGRSGERAAGIPGSALLAAINERGLEMPKITAADRGMLSRDAHAAARGDADAVARMQARHAHERAVFGVVQAALALVPDQPATGRPRMPEPSDALRNALAGHDVGAVEAVFTGLLKESERIR